MYSQQQQVDFEKAISFLVTYIKQDGHNSKPVILHSIRVALLLYNYNYSHKIVLAAFLHDLIEDSSCSYEDIAINFGKEVAEIVYALSFDNTITNRELRNKKEIDKAISFGKSAVYIKAADLLDNSDYYHLALPKLQPILIRKFKYFVKQAKKILINEPIWSEIITKDKALKKTLKLTS